MASIVTCTYPGCTREHRARGYCTAHYQRMRGGSDTPMDAPLRDNRVSRTPVRPCTHQGCDREYRSNGYCNLHLVRWKRGLPMDPSPHDLKPLGSIHMEHGYVKEKTAQGFRYQHRLVIEEYLGRSLHAHENVHHTNGDKSDNRLENLELWSTSQPAGQRVEDKIAWAHWFIKQYSCP